MPAVFPFAAGAVFFGGGPAAWVPVARLEGSHGPTRRSKISGAVRRYDNQDELCVAPVMEALIDTISSSRWHIRPFLKRVVDARRAGALWNSHILETGQESDQLENVGEV